MTVTPRDAKYPNAAEAERSVGYREIRWQPSIPRPPQLRRGVNVSRSGCGVEPAGSARVTMTGIGRYSLG